MSALERIIKQVKTDRQAKSLRKLARKTALVKRSSLMIEALEQRILLNADVLPTARVVDPNAAAGPAPIVAPLEAGKVEAIPRRTIADSADNTLTIAPQLLGSDVPFRSKDANNKPTDEFLTIAPQLADPPLPPLVVTGFIPTQTGFTVKFNREIEASVISLYDVKSGSVGAADATLTGAISGQVKGSLFFYNDQLWFFARGGVLPPDTYTATLRTAVNATKDMNGNLLDGNNDSIAGDNYGTIFTVNPSSDVIVSIPDFARAPGQGVSIPASDGGIPVTVSNGAGVTSVNLTLRYNPALFDIIGVKPGNSMPAGTRVNALYFSDFGHVEINVTSPVPLPAGPVEILRLAARVPQGVTYGTASILFISSATFNTGTAARLDPALIVAADFGDTTGNGTYSSTDCTPAPSLRRSGMPTPLAGRLTVCPGPRAKSGTLTMAPVNGATVKVVV